MFVRGENAKDEMAELGLVETEPRLEFAGLMEKPDPVWKLMSHFHTRSANLCRFSGNVNVKKHGGRFVPVRHQRGWTAANASLDNDIARVVV